MFTQLKSLLRSKTPTTPRESSAAHREGDEHRAAGRSSEAAEAYRRALAIDPGNADAHYGLGAIARQAGDVDAAVDHWNRAIECRRDFEIAYHGLYDLLAKAHQVERVRKLMDEASAACPGSAKIHNLHGRVLAVQGERAAAAASFRKACSLEPASAEHRMNLGHALMMIGEVDEAVANYHKALWFEPDLFEAHLALAAALERQDKRLEAIEQYREALALRPDSAVAQVSLGVALNAEGKFDEAIAAYRRAIEIDPGIAVAHVNLGGVLMLKGAKQEAIASYERALQVDPRSDVSHVLTALKGGDSERAPDRYVERLFDWYAESFDSHLVKGLSYTVPEKLAELLRPYADGPRWTVLDLGCGTGLAGAAVASFSRSLVGVDLSSKMLDKARERNLYDRLEQRDLLTMMQAEAAVSYDLIIAADVFVYLGKLDELAVEAHRLLRPGTYFAFSVESLDALADQDASGSEGCDYRLNETARFAHSAAYLAQLCERSGFESLQTVQTQSRVNVGKGVQGYLVLWKKPGVDAAAA